MSRRVAMVLARAMRAVLGLALAMGVLGAAPGARAQSFSPYSDFLAMTLAELETLQVKLTYGGPEERGVHTVMFGADALGLDPNVFVPYRRAGFSYANDLRAIESFAASPAELQACLVQASSLPEVSGGLADPNGVLSFALFNSVGGTDKGYEAILDLADGATLLQALRTALASNAEGVRRITQLGCHVGMLEPGTPADVTAIVTVALSGLRVDADTGRFVGTARLTNTSAAALAAPVSLVLDLPGGVHLANARGLTCATPPEGRGFIDLPGALGAGGSAEIPLELDNPEHRDLEIRPVKVLSGPGAR